MTFPTFGRHAGRLAGRPTERDGSYDPSYGNGPFASQAEWEDASLDGFTQQFVGGVFAKKNDLGAGSIETVFTPL